MAYEFKRKDSPENEVANMPPRIGVANIPPRLDINNLPKSPSILILTEPEIDIKGRFGKGTKLGWYKQKSDIEDEQIKLREEKDKGDKDKSKIKERRIMSIPLSSDRAMAQLREQSVLPMISLGEIKEIATFYSKQFGIPIVVSSEMGNNRYVDAMACMEAGRVQIHLHPILQYRDKGYIEAAILREVEECRDFMRERAFGWQRGR
jgi:hypothetical protein